ncbi:hypothetical protein ACQB6R_02550 [Propionibacteriaceae bacterium G1746]
MTRSWGWIAALVAGLVVVGSGVWLAAASGNNQQPNNPAITVGGATPRPAITVAPDDGSTDPSPGASTPAATSSDTSSTTAQQTTTQQTTTQRTTQAPRPKATRTTARKVTQAPPKPVYTADDDDDDDDEAEEPDDDD